MGEEQTILELAYGIEALIRDLESQMDRALKRGVTKDSAKSEAEPQNPNVLGEIINILHRNGKNLGDLTEVFSGEILARLAK